MPRPQPQRLGKRARAGLCDRQAGFSLVELMIAIVLLLVGVVAVAQLIPIAIGTNLANRNDSSALIIAQRQMEQMAAQMLTVGNPAANADYAFVNNFLPAGTVPNNVVNVGQAPPCPGMQASNCAGPVPPNNTVRGANLVGGTLNIDWGQAFAAVPAGYRNQFRTPEGFLYETRWNVTTFFANFNGVIQPVAKRIIISTRGGQPIGAAGGSPGEQLLPATVVTYVGERWQ
ncbi:MAG: prepilin-type N-terminal cleavage/methylation domain-containing protein [Acidobacteria bacterium]|nr:prepilin-type N-terminal cleavage/methylation domain-containing protein [Acidobacteriota bacterium]